MASAPKSSTSRGRVVVRAAPSAAPIMFALQKEPVQQVAAIPAQEPIVEQPLVDLTPCTEIPVPVVHVPLCAAPVAAPVAPVAQEPVAQSKSAPTLIAATMVGGSRVHQRKTSAKRSASVDANMERQQRRKCGTRLMARPCQFTSEVDSKTAAFDPSKLRSVIQQGVIVASSCSPARNREGCTIATAASSATLRDSHSLVGFGNQVRPEEFLDN